MKGDLDWIVMKALDKERDRRYETANGLAHDIGRYLNHEPVVAGPPAPGIACESSCAGTGVGSSRRRWCCSPCWPALPGQRRA